MESDITKKIDNDVFSTSKFLDTDKSCEDAAHKGDVKNFKGSEFNVSTNTSKFDVMKKIDLDVLRMDEVPATGDHVKNADEEVGDALRDTVGSPFGATKEKANEAGENLEEKTKAARKEASARADATKARGKLPFVDSHLCLHYSGQTFLLHFFSMLWSFQERGFIHDYHSAYERLVMLRQSSCVDRI